MSEALPTRACWMRDDAETILRIEALGVDDTLFLATHTPIRGFGVAGSNRQDLAEPTESALLDALSDSRRTHALCVVQGDPGSGKSHLIRWLAVHWPHGDDVVLLLQRADGSLQGALEQLQTKLTARSSEFAKLFEGLDKRSKMKIAGRAALFYSALAVMLGDIHEQPFEDVAFCEKHDLSLLMQSRHVRNWTSPRRILDLVDGKGHARNSESARFNLHDMVELAKLCGPVDDSVPAQRFARQLRAEADKITDWTAAGESLAEITSRHAGELPASLGLVKALNLRLNDAIQKEIGVSGESLVLLFREVRKALKGRARLVLLLEDITAWQGLDNSLIEALVLDAKTRDDVCPLISVVGVTPEYYDALQKNHLDRITHEIRLGQVGEGAREAATVREESDRLAFSARYLNATRAGAARLDAWREVVAADRFALPPNRCAECPHQTVCHDAFGHVDGMGLYPFTPDALDRLFHALRTDDKGQTHRTPRGLLQNVLGPSLRNPDMLDARQYPGADIETEKLEESARFLPGPMRALIEAKTVDPELRERLRRTVVYWGDAMQPVTTRDTAGHEVFAGVPASIFEAFGLPWLGGVLSEPAPQPPPVVTPPPPTTPSPEPPKAPDAGPGTNPGTDTGGGGTPGATPVQTRPTTSARPGGATKTRLQKLLAYIAEARTGAAALREPPLWNEVLYEAFRLIPARSLGVDNRTWSTVFTSSLVQVEGLGQARAYSFVVPRAPWLYDGLEAYCTLRGGGATATDEFSQRRLAFLLRRLGSLAVAHVRRRTPPLADGGAWNMAATATQTLLARAWLRGATSPDKPTHEQWRALLSDEMDQPTTDPQSRTEPWRDALRNTDQQHDKLRPLLREMITLPQGTSSEFGLADAGAAALGVVRLRDRFSFLPISEAGQSAALLDDRDLRQTAAKMREYMARIPNLEFKLLQERSAELDGLLHGEGLGSRADRFNKALEPAFRHLKDLPPEHERKWREDWKTISAALARPEMQASVLNLITVFETPTDIPDGLAERLGWLARQPAGDLRSFLAFLKDAEALAKLVVERAEAYEKTATAGANLAKLTASGTAMGEALKDIRTAWTTRS